MDEPAEPSATVRPAGVSARLILKVVRTRSLARLPIHLYRARLGFLFGRRFILLEHYGRVTGKRRRTVLELIGHPSPGTYLVVAALGERADWVKNIRANPRIRITIGSRHPVPAIARRLDGDEATAAMDAYIRAHPRAWKVLLPVLEGVLGRPYVDAGDIVIEAFSLVDRWGYRAF